MIKPRLLSALVISLFSIMTWGQNTPAQFDKDKLYTTECNSWVEKQLQTMSLKQKIGQLFIHTVSPYISPQGKADLRSAVTEYHIGGLLFSGGQVLNQIELTNYAQSMAEIPLLLTFDGEWGLSMRLKNTIAFPRNRILGCITEDSLIYAYGKEVARQCREIGVHINFAPVADVDNNPKNPVINTRSFGSNPQRVARLVSAYAKGLEDGGVIAVCKHFPGHGDTETDSHKALPRLDFDRARLDSIELVPFKRAITSGVNGVMVGHLLIPALDSQKPASLSHKLVSDILKNELGFKGLVFTDALAMQGVSGNDLAAQALIAGNDLLLVQRNLKREMDGVLNAIKQGKLTEADITERCRKVLSYKYAMGLTEKQYIQSGQVMNRLNKPEAKELVNALKKSAVTVVANPAKMLPFAQGSTGNMLISISASPSRMHPLYEQLKKSISVQWINLTPNAATPSIERFSKASHIIVAIESDNFMRFATLLEKLTKLKPTTLVFFTPLSALRGQRPFMEAAGAIVAAHSAEVEIQKHAGNILTGYAKADGVLSIDISDRFKAGQGVALQKTAPSVPTHENTATNTPDLQKIDEIAIEGIEAKAYPGCQIFILKNGKPVYNKCFGTVTYNSTEKVRPEHLYDLASLSKTTGTLLAVMKLYDQGKITLTDRIASFLPQFKGTDKGGITIQQLLYHESGLPAYLPFYRDAIDLESCKGGLFKNRKDADHTVQVGRTLYISTNFKNKAEWISPIPSKSFPLQVAENLYVKKEFKEVILQRIIDTPLKPKTYRYSCLNFIILKEIVETLTQKPMDLYLDDTFFRPMGLKRIAYNPLKRFSKEDIIPTVAYDFLRGKHPLQGYVHDEAAALLGGVSGNAGMFATAADVACVYQMLLNKGVYNQQRFLSKETCDLFLTMKSKRSRRGLGFDKPDPNNERISPCAPEAPRSVVGHTGFTGTCAWADPDNQLIMVFLSNRIYPDPYNRTQLTRLNIRPRIQEVMYKAFVRP